MHSLWPTPPNTSSVAELSDDDLARLYGYPDALTRPWVQVNFVASADGAVAIDEHSEGLSHPADKRIFGLGRDLADVILVGSGTAYAEQYRGARAGKRRTERRRALGLTDVPPIAVVSGRCSIPPTAPVFTDTTVPPLVLTSASAPAQRRNALADAGAEVIVAGDSAVHLPTALGELDARGMRRVNCEGGPQLFASMLAKDLVDQLCLTVAPLLAGPGAERIVAGMSAPAPRAFELASVLHEDGYLMLRYRRPQSRPS